MTCPTMLRAASALLGLILSATACRPGIPEGAVKPVGLQRGEGTRGMVAAAHPLAAQAGKQVLESGGNAVDAAVATAFAIGVVEPMMSGIGGGGAMTIWLEEHERAEVVDFYPRTGADSAWSRLLPREPAARPALGVAIPGTVAGLLDALERYGTKTPADVLAPAIRLARDGFAIGPLLAAQIAGNRDKLTREPGSAALFFPGGQPVAAGAPLVQEELARTLEHIASAGVDGFYRGPVAETIVAALRAGGSLITLEDLATYRATWRRPVCGTFRDFTVISAPPPLAGVEVLATLALLEPYDLRSIGPPAHDGRALSLVADAIRIARADRSSFVGFPDDAAVPAVGLASASYAAERRALIGGAVTEVLPPGDPWDEEGTAADPACAVHEPAAPTTLPRPVAGGARSGSPEDEEAQTTHLSVVDAGRNAVSLTFTLGLYFGSGSYAAGAFFNSAVANFGGPEANRPGPDRTPRSTIAPTIVLDGDDVRLVVGSPGSQYIGPAIVHTILYTLEYGFDPFTALSMPRMLPLTNVAEIRIEGGIRESALRELTRRGYTLDEHGPRTTAFGGVQVVLVRADGSLVGAADPRRDGGVAGY